MGKEVKPPQTTAKFLLNLCQKPCLSAISTYFTALERQGEGKWQTNCIFTCEILEQGKIFPSHTCPSGPVKMMYFIAKMTSHSPSTPHRHSLATVLLVCLFALSGCTGTEALMMIGATELIPPGRGFPNNASAAENRLGIRKYPKAARRTTLSLRQKFLRPRQLLWQIRIHHMIQVMHRKGLLFCPDPRLLQLQ